MPSWHRIILSKKLGRIFTTLLLVAFLAAVLWAWMNRPPRIRLTNGATVEVMYAGKKKEFTFHHSEGWRRLLIPVAGNIPKKYLDRLKIKQEKVKLEQTNQMTVVFRQVGPRKSKSEIAAYIKDEHGVTYGPASEHTLFTSTSSSDAQTMLAFDYYPRHLKSFSLSFFEMPQGGNVTLDSIGMITIRNPNRETRPFTVTGSQEAVVDDQGSKLHIKGNVITNLFITESIFDIEIKFPLHGRFEIVRNSKEPILIIELNGKDSIGNSLQSQIHRTPKDPNAIYVAALIPNVPVEMEFRYVHTADFAKQNQFTFSEVPIPSQTFAPINRDLAGPWGMLKLNHGDSLNFLQNIFASKEMKKLQFTANIKPGMALFFLDPLQPIESARLKLIGTPEKKVNFELFIQGPAGSPTNLTFAVLPVHTVKARLTPRLEEKP